MHANDFAVRLLALVGPDSSAIRPLKGALRPLVDADLRNRSAAQNAMNAVPLIGSRRSRTSRALLFAILDVKPGLVPRSVHTLRQLDDVEYVSIPVEVEAPLRFTKIFAT